MQKLTIKKQVLGFKPGKLTKLNAKNKNISKLKASSTHENTSTESQTETL